METGSIVKMNCGCNTNLWRLPDRCQVLKALRIVVNARSPFIRLWCKVRFIEAKSIASHSKL